jgi:hypothetical protein
MDERGADDRERSRSGKSCFPHGVPSKGDQLPQVEMGAHVVAS